MISKELLLGMEVRAVCAIKAEELWRILDKEELEYIFKCCNAFWHHPGKKNIKAPHVRLTTGKHSDIFVKGLAQFSLKLKGLIS